MLSPYRIPGFSANCNNLLLLIAVVFIFAAPQCLAQFRSTQWTADSGLPQNSVRGIVLTPDGYIWVGTLNGVARFDGVRFVTFDKSNTPAITTNRFVEMIGGAPGDLWLAGEDGRIIRYHDGQFTAIGRKNGFEPRSTLDMTSDNNGSVWILSGKEIYRWDEPTQKFLHVLGGSDGLQFNRLWWFGTGFWALDGGTLRYFFHGQYKSAALPGFILRSRIRAVAVSGEGAIWIATSDHKFFRMEGNKYEQVHGVLEAPLQGRGQPGWKYQVQDNFTRTAIIPSSGFEKGIHYNIIARDNGDNIWIGSEGQGLFRIQRQSITVYSMEHGLASANVYPVMRARDGDMWIGTWGPAGLTHIHNGVFKSYTAKDGLPGLVTALMEDHLGRIWVGSHGGVRVFTNGRFAMPPGLNEKLQPNVIYESGDGTIWMGTSDGIYILTASGSHWLTAKDGLATNDVRAIVSSSDGSLWVGGYGGLTRIKNGSFMRWTEQQGLPSNNVRTVYEDPNGDVWIGTYDGGLGLLHHGKWAVFNKKNGLFDDGVFQILEDSQGNLWMSSNRGIFRVRKAQLLGYVEGKEPRIDSIGYGKSDGMLSVECNGGLWPAGARDDKGHLWFPTQNGVAVVDPNLLNESKAAPRVVIENVTIDHAAVNSTRGITIRPGQNALEIQYTALSFLKPGQTDFQYKLDGADNDWEYVGRRRTAYYNRLPPGKFTFHLRAVNSNGVMSQTDATLPITVIPPFYWRWWFLLSIGVFVLSITWLSWKWRIRQLERIQATQKAFSQQLIASQEGERRRIAAELHDSLGQRLIIINNLALFLLRPKGKAHTEEDKRQAIQEISGEATAAMEETRAISYDLRPFQLDRLGLTRAIQGLARTATRASGIQFATTIADIDNVFPDDMRINLFRIIQEGVNNIIKHSGAMSATIVAELTETTLALSITDNGKGIPPEPRRVQVGSGGFGLTGIEERASLLNGKLKIRSAAGGGTLLMITFPLEKRPLDV